MNVLHRVFVLAAGLSLLASSWSVQAAENWRAGAASRIITPKEPMWMAGYGARTAPSSGKLNELKAKALVLQDAQGSRGVVLTLDLVGIDRELSRRVAKAISERIGVPVANVVIATSHTHSGPVVGKNLGTLHYYQLDKHFQQQIDTYAEELFQNCVEVADAAAQQSVPCTLSWGTGASDFATNRRNNKEGDGPRLRTEGKLAGPSDFDVPVLAVRNLDGKLVSVLFGYACHATVLAGNVWSGDYPGFAQDRLEESHPGCVALFFAGCGADQNPIPRRNAELARHYGERLATAVDRVLLTTAMEEASPKLDCRYAEVALPLSELPTAEQLKGQLSSSNKSEATRARVLLDQIASGHELSPTYPYPVSVWRIGDKLKFVALGGEVVVDYALRTKADLDGPVWVAGYAHDVMAYIPSRRVLSEGGYEGGGAMVYYGLPCPWAPEVEETLMGQVVQLAQEVEPGK